MSVIFGTCLLIASCSIMACMVWITFVIRAVRASRGMKTDLREFWEVGGLLGIAGLGLMSFIGIMAICGRVI